jgi:hypothetical protein
MPECKSSRELVHGSHFAAYGTQLRFTQVARYFAWREGEQHAEAPPLGRLEGHQELAGLGGQRGGYPGPVRLQISQQFDFTFNLRPGAVGFAVDFENVLGRLVLEEVGVAYPAQQVAPAQAR